MISLRRHENMPHVFPVPAERFYGVHASAANLVHQILQQEDDESSILLNTVTKSEHIEHRYRHHTPN